MDKDDIKSKITDILHRVFSSPQKCTIKDNITRLRFSCPICMDSLKDPWKKRGNFYIDTGNFHCFNCGVHINAIKFFRKFHVELNTEESNYFYKIIAENATRKLSSNIELGEILKYSVDFKKFIRKFKIELCDEEHPFIKNRFLKHKASTIGFKGKDVYVFNLVGDRLIGFQIKENYGTKYERYNKIPLSEMHRAYIKSDKINSEELQKFDKVSLVYGLFMLDFDQPITVFEGAINSFFMKNSIATSTVNLKLDLLNTIENTRYFFDNDLPGKKKMISLLKEGNSVFMWDKFMEKEKIERTDKWIEYRRKLKKSTDINDMNDIVLYAKINKRGAILKSIENYFSNNMLDAIYI